MVRSIFNTVNILRENSVFEAQVVENPEK